MKDIKVTADINLELLETKHAEALFSTVHKNRTYLRKWMAWLDNTRSVNDALNFIKSTHNSRKSSQLYTWAIHYKSQLVGIVGQNVKFSQSKMVEMGYWLDKDLQGRGIVSQSLKTAIDYTFNHQDIDMIQIKAATENKPSRAVPLRLGFHFEGILQQREWLYDHYVDHASYTLTRKAWSKL